MKLLLDTQTWVCGILEPARIKPKVAAILSDQENELWLSPISVWEVLILARKGRLELDPDAHQWVRRWLRERPMHEAALTREVAVQSDLVDLPQKDPADRFLAATALVFGLTLVTSDAQPYFRVQGDRDSAEPIIMW